MRRGSYGLFAGVVLLAGCAAVPQPGCARLAPAGTYCLQPLPAGQVIALQQMVHYRLSGMPAEDRMLFAVDAEGGAFHLAALSPMGQTLLTLSWHGSTVDWEGGPQLTPVAEVLPMLVQLTLWPADALLPGLHGLRVVDAAGERRLLDALGGAVLTIRHVDPASPADPTEIDYPQAGARLRIETLGD